MVDIFYTFCGCNVFNLLSFFSSRKGLPLHLCIYWTLNEESNKVDETEKHLQNISIEMIKELFTEMFKVQEEKLFPLATQIQLWD